MDTRTVDRSEIRERFLLSHRGEGASFSDLIMGGLMALAGIVAIDVLSGPADNIFRAIMWLGSMTTVWTMYDVGRHRAIYEIAHVRTARRIIGRLANIVHFGFFAFLANTFLSHRYWAYWCAAIALNSALAIAQGLTGSVTRTLAIDAAPLGEFIDSTNARRGVWAISYALTGALIAVFAFFAPARFDVYAKMMVAGFAFACVVIDVVFMRDEDAVMDKIEALSLNP